MQRRMLEMTLLFVSLVSESCIPSVSQGFKAFVSVWADMAEEDPDSDVLIEFEGFSEVGNFF